MRTPKTDRETIRDEMLIVKMSPAEKAELQEAADKKGLPMSSYIRMLVKQDIERGKNND